MGRKRTESKLESLALAVAVGESVSSWSKRTGTALRTARTWSSLPETRAMVREIRARLLDRAIGKLASGSAGAEAVVLKLAAGAESEQVRLSAARAVLNDLAAMKQLADFEERLEAIERSLRKGR